MDLSSLDIRNIVDLERLEQLLTDVSRLMNLNIRLFDVYGNVVHQVPAGGVSCLDSIGCPAIPERCEAELRTLFDRIKEEGGPIRDDCSHGFSLYGLNIGTPPAVFGVINACQVATAVAPGRRSIPAGNEDDTTKPEDRLFRFLSNIADLVANECYQNVELDNLSTELETRYEELNLIYEIGKEIKITDNLESTIEFFATKSLEVLVAACMTFVSDIFQECFIFDGEGAGIGKGEDNPELVTLSRHLAELVGSGREPVVFNDLTVLPGVTDTITARYDAVLSLPLIASEKMYGVINIFKASGEGVIHSGDVKLMNSLGKEAAIVIKNSELFQNLRSLFINMLKTLVFTIEAKDQYTSGHSERVNRYSMALGRLLDYGIREMEVLNSASLLHDIGKLRVPGELLRKPGRLSDDEWTVIRTHPASGAQILSPIQEFQLPILGVRHHHERWDGGGYPDGLHGESIPESARIIAIADTYDALTSKRSYRESLHHLAAIREIERCLGSQFDPQIGALFIQHFSESPDGDEGGLLETVL